MLLEKQNSKDIVEFLCEFKSSNSPFNVKKYIIWDLIFNSKTKYDRAAKNGISIKSDQRNVCLLILGARVEMPAKTCLVKPCAYRLTR